MPISQVPVNSVGTPFPTVTSDLQVGSGKQLTADDIKSKEGMTILADPTEQLSLGQLKPSEADKLLERAGVESRRLPEDSQLGELCRSHHLSLNDPQLEQLFPHLYPHGTGGYNYRCSSGDDNTRVITLGIYVKMRLLHVDPRWRHDKLWMFFAYDWVMKTRIIQYNLKRPKTTVASDGRDKPLTREYILSDLGEGEIAYDRLGQMVQPNLPGTKTYWSKDTSTLLLSVRGRVFLTIS